MTPRLILIALALRHSGEWENIYKDVVEKNTPSDEEIEKAKQVENQCITMLDNDYPETLKQTYKPPFVLFYKGDKTLLSNDNIIAVVGSREPNEQTMTFTEKFLEKHSDKTIITTDAKGTNEKVRKATRRNETKCIVVVSSGIDYQAVLGDLVISEYPDKTTPDSNTMTGKYRIISSLATKVCVMSIKQYSGTNILITNALNSGKEIYVRPETNEEDNYANTLIEEGANCLTLATEI